LQEGYEERPLNIGNNKNGKVVPINTMGHEGGCQIMTHQLTGKASRATELTQLHHKGSNPIL
jgi:hypothetical protein